MKKSNVRTFSNRKIFTSQWLWSSDDILTGILVFGMLQIVLFPVTFLGNIFEEKLSILATLGKTWWQIIHFLLFLIAAKRNERSELPIKGCLADYKMDNSDMSTSDAIWCPRCEERGIGTSHGLTQQCPNCDLWIVTYGNSISMAETEAKLHSTPKPKSKPQPLKVVRYRGRTKKVIVFRKPKYFTKQWLDAGPNEKGDLLRGLTMFGFIVLILAVALPFAAIGDDMVSEYFSKLWWMYPWALLTLISINRENRSELPAHETLSCYKVKSNKNPEMDIRNFIDSRMAYHKKHYYKRGVPENELRNMAYDDLRCSEVIWCPRCKKQQIRTFHGHTQQCPSCDLWIVTHGNSISMAQTEAKLG